MPLSNARGGRSWATIAVILAIVFGLWFNQARGLKKVANDTHTSLCALKNDIQTRHEAGVNYLLDHPRGLVSSRGEVIISRPLLKQSLDAQQATIDSLDSLDC